jgi:predicted transcriptional regulator/transcriptional regulator with XRE-family HTH domain
MKNTHAHMGTRLRELRTTRGLQQGEVARRLGVSPAYLSLIEKDKRAVQLPLLFKALELYGVGMEEFMQSLGERRVDDGLARLLDEPLLRSLNLSEDDLAQLGSEPRMATTVTALFNMYKNTRGQLDHLLSQLAKAERDTMGAGGMSFDYNPFDEVTDFLEANDNWFGTLEDRAEQVRRDFSLPQRYTSDRLLDVLRSMGVDVVLVPPDDTSSVVRRWDPEHPRLTLTSSMVEQRLKFQLAHTIGLWLMDREGLHDLLTANFRTRHTETPQLIKIHLANYFAGALLLPYNDFFHEVVRTRYDLEHLASYFESSFETVAHRVCNLNDPQKRALPMHFLRVDVAGNISKRYGGRTGIQFPHGTGSCPKLAVHLSFLNPSQITKQYSVFPDGSEYFCVAKVVKQPFQGSLVRGTVYAIGLGTNASNAKHLCYADDMPFADPRKMAINVGTTCRFCERTDCNQRAAPSYKFAFRVDEYTKKDNFFSPLVSNDQLEDVDPPKKREKRTLPLLEAPSDVPLVEADAEA